MESRKHIKGLEPHEDSGAFLLEAMNGLWHNPQAANIQGGDGKVPSLLHDCQHQSLVQAGWTFSATQLE